jgi:hypothetical protein
MLAKATLQNYAKKIWMEDYHVLISSCCCNCSKLYDLILLNESMQFHFKKKKKKKKTSIYTNMIYIK